MQINRHVKVSANILIGCALLIFIGYFLIYCFYAYRLFLFPFDYDQGEGFELLDTILFSQGEWPYRNSDVYPFYSSNYPPVYHLVIVPLVWLFGPQYWTGRLVSFLSTLVTGWLIGFAIVRTQKNRRWWLVVLTTLTFFASNYVYHVGPLFRQHIFMVMFETAAIVLMGIVVEKREQKGQYPIWHLLLVFLLLLLAGYTKQLAYATVAALFIFWFLRDIRRSILWAIPFALVTGLIFLYINWATGNQWYINSIAANLNEFIFGQMVGLYRQWFKLHRMITLVAIGMLLYELYFDRLSIYAVWFVVTVANSATAGTWGAGESYFITTVVSSIILTGIGLSKLLDTLEEREQTNGETSRFPLQPATLTLFIIPLLFFWQANRFFHMPTNHPLLAHIATLTGRPSATVIPPQTSCSEPRPPQPIPYVDDAFILIGRPPTDADTAAGIEITQLLLEGETPAFSEEAGFNLYAGREVVTNPTQLRNLNLAGYLDTTEMVDMLDKQAFDTVIFRAQFYPPEVLTIIGQRYQTEELVEMNGFVYCILRPN